MKKFILLIVVMFSTIFTLNAQIATQNSKLFDNTYIGAEFGETTPLNFNSMFPLNTVVGFKVGKEFTPVIGVEAEGQFFLNENNESKWTNTFIKGTLFNLNNTINYSNWFFGYKGTPRVFEFNSNMGIGWLNRWNNNGDNGLVVKTSLDLKFNIGKTKNHALIVSPGIYWLLSDNSNTNFNKNHAQLAIMSSYVYHFKTSNDTHHFRTYDVGAMIAEIDRLNSELANKPQTVEVVKYVNHYTNLSNSYIFFAYDNAELDERAMNDLNALDKTKTYDIDAFASNEGDTAYNIALSQRRADAVKKYLEDNGYKVDKAIGHGVQFGYTTGRVALITSK